MDAIYPEINLGESICRRIKQAYYPHVAWPECYQQVAKDFTELKKIARKFFSTEDEQGMLKQLTRFQEEDIAEMMEKPLWIAASPSLVSAASHIAANTLAT